MPLPSIDDLLNNKTLVTASAIAGAVITKLVDFYKHRVKVLEYSVTHTPVAFAADDAVFGSIQVTWQGNPVQSLYVSRVELVNDTGSDLSDLKIVAYTGTTFLLNQHTGLIGSPYIVDFADDYAQKIKIAAGETPTAEQQRLYNTRREYKIPVLNRHQRIALTYLTTTPPGEQPAVFLDTSHAGLALRYRPTGPSILGVPLKLAIVTGLVLSFAVLLCVAFFVSSPVVAGILCMVFGLAASVAGALTVRAARLIQSIALQ